MKTTKHKYDIVILGAGCSGMLLSFFLSNKKTKHKKKNFTNRKKSIIRI